MSPVEKRFAVWGLIIAVGSLCVGTLSYCSDFFDRREPQVNATTLPVVPLIIPTSPATEASKLEPLVRSRIIGSPIFYWESISGPPISEYSGWREYEVESCELHTFSDDEKILSVRIVLSPACTFDWQKVIYNARSLPPAHQTTFGQFVDQLGPGDYLASCLISCGNASDPYLLMAWQGSRADGWIEVNLGADMIGDHALDAGISIGDHYQRSLGRDAVILEQKFNCADDRMDVFGPALKDVRIQWVEFGSGLNSSNSLRPEENCAN